MEGQGTGAQEGDLPRRPGGRGTYRASLPMSHCGDPAPLAPGHQSPKLCRYSWLQAVLLGGWVGGGLPPWGAPGSTHTLLQAWRDSPEMSRGACPATQRPAAGLNVKTKVHSAMSSPAQQNRGPWGPRSLREEAQPGSEPFWWCPGRAGVGKVQALGTRRQLARSRQGYGSRPALRTAGLCPSQGAAQCTRPGHDYKC